MAFRALEALLRSCSLPQPGCYWKHMVFNPCLQCHALAQKASCFGSCSPGIWPGLPPMGFCRESKV